jgi:phosphate:Na+ symporter
VVSPIANQTMIAEAVAAGADLCLMKPFDTGSLCEHLRRLLESRGKKGTALSPAAQTELKVLTDAVAQIIDLSFRAFLSMDLEAARSIEPLEEVIDDLKDQLRDRHIQRLQQGSCSIETGFVWSEVLTGLERIGDHCANLAGAVIDLHHHNRNSHETHRLYKKENPDFARQFADYQAQFHL